MKKKKFTLISFHTKMIWYCPTKYWVNLDKDFSQPVCIAFTVAGQMKKKVSNTHSIFFCEQNIKIFLFCFDWIHDLLWKFLNDDININNLIRIIQVEITIIQLYKLRNLLNFVWRLIANTNIQKSSIDMSEVICRD